MGLTDRLDENLFGRVGVFNGFLRREQLEECLEDEKLSSGRVDLGQILLEKGYITEEQLHRIREIRRKKVRKMLRDTKEVERSEKRFGQVALSRGFVRLLDIESALLEQERLRKMNLRFRLGEILLSLGLLLPDHVLAILEEQGKRILNCPTCDSHYHVLDFREGKTYRCRKCGDLLGEPLFLDSIAVDGAIGGEADGEGSIAVDGPLCEIPSEA